MTPNIGVPLPSPLPALPLASASPPAPGAECGRGHHYWIEPPDVRVGNTTLNAVCLKCWCWRRYIKFPFRDWGGRMQE